MSPSTKPPLTSRAARMRRALTRFAALTLTVGVMASSAFAGDAAKADKPSAPVTPGVESADTSVELSPYELAELIRERLHAYTAAPRASARESAVRSAWRIALKPRARRMVGRMDHVSDSKRWDVRGETADTWAPQAKATARVMRELATLYVELATARKDMAKARIVEGRVTKFGHMRARRERKPIREAEIAGTRMGFGFGLKRTEVEDGNGNDLGSATSFKLDLKGQTRRVKIKMFDREIEKRLADERQAAFDADVGAIRARLDAYTRSLDKDLQLVRTLAASLQLAEEMRLADSARTIQDSGARRSALILLDKMKVTRREARRKSFDRASRYGAALRTGWLQKRVKLERLLKKHTKAA